MWHWLAVLAASIVSKPDSSKMLPPVSIRDYRLHDQPAGSTSIRLNRSITSGFPGLSAAEIAAQDGCIAIRSQGPGLVATSQFRGGQAAQTAIFWEGIPLGNAMLGQQDLSLLPAALLGEARLTPGSQGGTLGNQAIAGSLHFSQAFQSEKPWNTSISFQTGSWGQATALLTAQGTLRNNSLQLAYYRHQAFNDFPVRDYFSMIPGYRKQPNARQDMQAARLSTAGVIGKGFRYSYHLLYTGSEREIPPTLTQKSAEARQQDQALRQVFQLDRGTMRNKLRMRIYYQWEQLNYRDLSTAIQSHSDVHDGGVEVFWSRTLSKQWQISTQGGWQHQQANSSVYLAQINRYSGQVQLNYQANRPRLHWTTALRAELVGNTFSGIQPYTGITLGDSTLRWTFHASGHFRYPTLNDLFWVPGGNSALQPERGWGTETGLETSFGIFRLKLNAYWRTTNQLIFWRPFNAGIWTPVNLTDAQSLGVEAGLTLRWRGFIATSSGQIGHFTRNQGRENTPYIPRFTGTQWIEQRWGPWQFALCFSYRSQVEDPEAINGKLPAFVIADFFLKRGFSIGKQALSFSAMIRNFTDQEYQMVTWRAMPGINWGLALQWSLRQNHSK